MHANPAGFRRATRTGTRCSTDAVRRGMNQVTPPPTCAKWTYGTWHVVDIEHPLARIPALHQPHRRHRRAAAQRRHHHREAGGPHLRPIAALHHGLEQHRRLNRRHRPGRKRQPLQPLLPRPVGRLLQRPHLRASLHSRGRGRQHAAHPAPDAMNDQGAGNREQGIRGQLRVRNWVPQVSRLRPGNPMAGAASSVPPSFALPPSSLPPLTSSAKRPADTTSTSISPRGSMRKPVGGMAFFIPIGRPALTTAPASRVSSFIRRLRGCSAQHSA